VGNAKRQKEQFRETKIKVIKVLDGPEKPRYAKPIKTVVKQEQSFSSRGLACDSLSTIAIC
jgi:hypothetical protein